MAVGERLEVEGLAFGYAGRLVGRDVSFALGAGRVLCLLGPNGSGKTTLFRTILRLLAPRGGTVAVDGERVERWAPRRLARTFGYVPQAQPALFPFTVREMALMGRASRIGLFQTPGRRDRAVVDDTLDLLGIAHLADRPYPVVSGGERQLALIARAIAQEPRVLVMDEPTASLDFGNQVRVLSELQGLAARGIAVILSTHDPDQAFLCADQVALLSAGRLVAIGDPSAVLTAAALRELYGVEVDVVAISRGGRPLRVCVPRLAAGGRGRGQEGGILAGP
jgi:iron complex transport system ATP-binding protein